MRKEIYIVMEPDRGYGQYAVVAFFSKESAERYIEEHRGTWIDIVEIE
jgi:hypothetical protein